jgi:hypothetical protein
MLLLLLLAFPPFLCSFVILIIFFSQAHNAQTDLVITYMLFGCSPVALSTLDGFGEQGRPSIGNEAAVPPDATLYVNLQLMSWTKVSHLGENQDIIKRTPTHHTPYNCKKPHNQSVVKGI